MRQAKPNHLFPSLARDERGLSTVEYVVLLVLIVAIAVAAWNVFGNSLVAKLVAAAVEFDEEVVTAKSGTAEDSSSSGTEAPSADPGASGAALGPSTVVAE